jgi:four helix bundle protein
MNLVENVYRQTRSFPADERFGLTSQIQRAAVSIPSNIAEGSGRNSQPEVSRFISIAYGSLCELETQLAIAQRLGYLNESSFNHLFAETTEVGKLLRGFQKSLKSSAAT